MSVQARSRGGIEVYAANASHRLIKGQTFSVTFEFVTSGITDENIKNLIVKYRRASDNALIDLNYDDDYLVTVNDPIEQRLDIFGTIQLLRNIEDVLYLVIQRRVENSQDIDAFSNASIQDIINSLDKRTMVSQDQGQLSGSVRMPIDKVVVNNISGDIVADYTPNSLLGVKDDMSKIVPIFPDGETIKFVDDENGNRVLASFASNPECTIVGDCMAVWKKEQLDENGVVCNVTYALLPLLVSGDNRIKIKAVDYSAPNNTDDGNAATPADGSSSNGDIRAGGKMIYPQHQYSLSLDVDDLVKEVVEQIENTTPGGTIENTETVREIVREVAKTVRYKGGKNISVSKNELALKETVVAAIRTALPLVINSVPSAALSALGLAPELLQQLLSGDVTNLAADTILSIGQSLMQDYIFSALPSWVQSLLPADLNELAENQDVYVINCDLKGSGAIEIDDETHKVKSKLQGGTHIEIDDDFHINSLLRSGKGISIDENNHEVSSTLTAGTYMRIRGIDDTIHSTLRPSDNVRFTEAEGEEGEGSITKIEAPSVGIAQSAQDILEVSTEQNDGTVTSYLIGIKDRDALKGDPGEKGDPGDPGQDAAMPEIKIVDNVFYVNDTAVGKLEGIQNIDVDIDGVLWINGVKRGYVSTEKITVNGVDKLRIVSSDGLIKETQPSIGQDGTYTFDLVATELFKNNLKESVVNEVTSKLLDKYNHTSGCNCNTSGSGSSSGDVTVNVTMPEIKNSINQDIRQEGSDINNAINEVAKEATEKFVNDTTSNMYKAPLYTGGNNVYITGGYGYNVDESGNVTNKNDADEMSWYEKVFRGVLDIAPSIMSVVAPEYAPIVSAVKSFVNVVDQSRQQQSVGAWYNGIADTLFGNSSFLGGIVDKVKDFLPSSIQAILPGNNKQFDKDYNANMPVYCFNARDYNYSSPNNTIEISVRENGKRSSEIDLDISAEAMQRLKGEKGDKGDPGVNGGESFGITFDPTIIINNVGYDTDVVPGGDTIGRGGNVVVNNIYNETQNVNNKSSLYTLLHNISTAYMPPVAATSQVTDSMLRVFYISTTSKCFYNSRGSQFIRHVGIDSNGVLYGLYGSEWFVLGNLLPSNSSGVTPKISSVAFIETKQTFLLVASNVNHIYVAQYDVSTRGENKINSTVSIDTSTYCSSPYGQSGGQCCDIQVTGGYYFLVAPSNNETTGQLLQINVLDPTAPTVTTIDEFSKSQCPGGIYRLKSLYMNGTSSQQYGRGVIIVNNAGTVYRQMFTDAAPVFAETFTIGEKALSDANAEVVPLGVINVSLEQAHIESQLNAFIFFKYKDNNTWKWSCLGLTGVNNVFMKLDAEVIIPEISNILIDNDNNNYYSRTDNVFYDDNGYSYKLSFAAHSDTTQTNNKVSEIKRLTASMEEARNYIPLNYLVESEKLIYVSSKYYLACTASAYTDKFSLDNLEWGALKLYSNNIKYSGTYKVVKTKYVFDGYASALVETTYDSHKYQVFIFTKNGGQDWETKTFAVDTNYIDFMYGQDGILFIPASGMAYAKLASPTSLIEYKELPSELTIENAIGCFALKNNYCIVSQFYDEDNDTNETVSVLIGSVQSGNDASENITWSKTRYDANSDNNVLWLVRSGFDTLQPVKSLVAVGDFKLNDTIHSMVVLPLVNKGFAYAIDGVEFNETFIDFAYDTDSELITHTKPVFDGKDIVATLVHNYDGEEPEDITDENYMSSQIHISQIEDYYGTFRMDNRRCVTPPTIAGYRPKALAYFRNNGQWGLFYAPIDDANKNLMVVISNDITAIDNDRSFEILGSSQNKIGAIDLETLSFNQYGYFATGSTRCMCSIEPMTFLQTILYLSAQTDALQKKEREQLVTDIDTLNTTIANLQNQIAALNQQITVINESSVKKSDVDENISTLDSNITNLIELDATKNSQINNLEINQRTLAKNLRLLTDTMLTNAKTDEAVNIVEGVSEEYVSEAKLNHLLTMLRLVTGGQNEGASTYNSTDPITWYAQTLVETEAYGGKYGGKKINKWSDLDLGTNNSPERYVSMTLNVLIETVYQLAGLTLKSGLFTNVKDTYFSEQELLKFAYSLGTMSINPNLSREYNRDRVKSWDELSYGAGERFKNTAAGKVISKDISDHGETEYHTNSSYVAPATTEMETEYQFDVPAMNSSQAAEYLLALRKAMPTVSASERRRFLAALKTGGSAFDKTLWTYLCAATAYLKSKKKKSIIDLVGMMVLTMPSFGGGTGGTISLGSIGETDSGSLGNLEWMGDTSSLNSTLANSDWLISLGDDNTTLVDSSSDWLIKL